MRSDKTDHFLLAGLLLLGAALKFSWLGENDLSGDEPFTVFWATRPWSEFTGMLRTENNPPLHFLLVKAWMWGLPATPAWLRAPSALLSVLTVWPLFLLSRALSGRMAAWATCCLFTLTNHQFGFAHEVRGYTLLLLLTAMALWLLVRGPRPGRAGRIGYIASLSAAFIALVWTHFFGWVVIGLLGLCAVLIPELRERRWSMLTSAGLAMLGFMPYAFIFLHRAGESIAHGTWVEPHGVEEVWHMVRRWSNQPLVTILLLLPVVVITIRERARSLALRLSLLWWLTPLLGLWLIQWWIPVYVDRYLLFASLGFYLAVGHSLAHLLPTGPMRAVPPLAGVLAMGLTFTPWQGNGQHPAQAAERVRAWRRSLKDPPVLVLPPWYKPTVWAHLERPFPGGVPWADPWAERYNDAHGGPSLSEARDLIVVYFDQPDRKEVAPGVDGFRKAEEVRVDERLRVVRYIR